MKHIIKKYKRPIIVVVGILLIALIVYGIVQNKKEDALLQQHELLGGNISTSFGQMTLLHSGIETILDGTLSRRTPCVHWDVVVRRVDTGTSVDIRDGNRDEVCVQSLGTPQTIHQIITDTAEETVYIVNLEGTAVFLGALEPVVIPSAPSEGIAQ